MSVQSNTYVMVGVMLPYERFTEEQHEAMEPYQDSAYDGIHHHDGLCVIADGMSGKYVAIGRVLAKSDDQNGNYGFNEPVDCKAKKKLRAEVEELIACTFGITGHKVKCWAFTNYR